MTITNITSFRKDIFSIMENTIKFDEPINIITKQGNAVLISENDYNNLLETLEINNNQYLNDKIIKGLNTPIDECISNDEVNW